MQYKCPIGNVLCTAAFVLTIAGLAWSQPIAKPFETDQPYVPFNQVDKLVKKSLDKAGIPPARLCSDEVFLRRVYLDVTGRLPDAGAVRKFLHDDYPDKRAEVIDELLAGETYADYWALKWGDILRIKAEFPINLWPNAVQAYHRWIYQSLRDNVPYDQFVREMLTASGSNFRVPAVNFYRALQGQESANIAAAVALTFMGTRIDTWPAEKREDMEAFFTRIAFKRTAEWKEEIVYLDPAAITPLAATFPDGRTVEIPVGADPRRVFADWLIRPNNPYFARNIVNRIWSWLMGRGIIHEPDDIRPDNPPSNPQLLAFLERQLVQHRYDLRHIYRLILNSRTYQQSSIPRSDHAQAAALFAYYPIRQLDAEVLIDALNAISGTGERYSSLIPEPFTFIPEEHHSVALYDGSITSPFLEMFGRPPRDTGLESERTRQPTDAQRLHLLNSTHVQNKIEKGPRIQGMIRSARGNRRMLVNMAYLGVLSRYPQDEEMQTALAYYDEDDRTSREGTQDLIWALINTKEFLCRH